MAHPALIEPASDRAIRARREQLRKHMQERDLDVILVAATNNRDQKGYLRYLTNYVVSGFCDYLIVPAEDEPIFVGHYAGRAAEVKEYNDIRDARYVPGKPTNTYERDAPFIADIIKNELKANYVGLAGPSIMTGDFYSALMVELSGKRLEDVTRIIDNIVAIKSPEEIRLIEKCAELGDLAIEEFRKSARPGRREYAVVADVDHVLRLNGSEDQHYLLGSGEKPSLHYAHLWNRTLKEGDLIWFLAEVSGPGGYYTEMGRTFSLGRPKKETAKAFMDLREIHSEAVYQLKPTRKISDAATVIRRKVQEKGYAEITGTYGHCQGLNIFERPLLHVEEHAELKEGMHLSVHPTTILPDGTGRGYFSENYVITENGPRRLFKTVQEIIEL